MQVFSALLLNLDCDAARLAHMCQQLAQAGVVYQRQSGILGDAVPEDLRPHFFTPDGRPTTKMKRGEIGCYASHLRALHRVASGELGRVVLIMEDDLNIAPGFLTLVAAALAALPPGWDILRLSNPPRRAYAPLAWLDDTHRLVRYSKIPTSAGAYLVTPTGARKFIARGIRGLSFDDDLRRPWFHDMDTYGIVPPPARAGALDQSTIDAVESGRFDKGVSSRKERFRRGDYAHTLRRVRYNIGSLGVAGWTACAAINLVAALAVHPRTKRRIIERAAALFPAARPT